MKNMKRSFYIMMQKITRQCFFYPLHIWWYNCSKRPWHILLSFTSLVLTLYSSVLSFPAFLIPPYHSVQFTLFNFPSICRSRALIHALRHSLSQRLWWRSLNQSDGKWSVDNKGHTEKGKTWAERAHERSITPVFLLNQELERKNAEDKCTLYHIYAER